jgi:hypothetical protein
VEWEEEDDDEEEKVQASNCPGGGVGEVSGVTSLRALIKFCCVVALRGGLC